MGQPIAQLASRPDDIINVKAVGAVGDGVTDDTAAFLTAFSVMQTATFGATIMVPNGDYRISTALGAVLGANQRVVLRSDGQHSARLHFTNPDSAGISLKFSPVAAATWISNGPSASIDGLTFISDWSNSTGQTAISVTNELHGADHAMLSRPLVPSVYIHNVSSLSKTNSGGFGWLVQLSGVAVSKLENLSLWASTGDVTASALRLVNTVGSATGIRINGIRQQAGGTAVIITDNLQGVYITDMQTVGTQHSISWTNPAGYTAADSLIVDHSHLNSLLSEIDTNGVSHVQIANNYLLGNISGWYGVNLSKGVGHLIIGNVIVQTSPRGDPTGSGVILNDTAGALVNNNTLYGLTGATSTGAPILLLGATSSTLVLGNNSATAFIGFDASYNVKANHFVSNVAGNVLFSRGTLPESQY